MTELLPEVQLPSTPQLPGTDAQGNIIHDTTPGLPPLGGPSDPNMLPPPLGMYVALLANSFIVANPASTWDIEIYFAAARKFVFKVIEENPPEERWKILEKISGLSN